MTNSVFKTPAICSHLVSVRSLEFKIIFQEYFDEKFSESNNRIFIFWFPVSLLERELALFTEYSLITCWSTDIIWYDCSNWFYKSIKSMFSVKIGNLHNMSRNRNSVSLFNLYFLSGLHVHFPPYKILSIFQIIHLVKSIFHPVLDYGTDILGTFCNKNVFLRALESSNR